MKAGAVFVAAALWSGSGHACYTPPSHQLMGVNEQIAQATDVSLATVAGAALLENGKVRYDFVVRKRLIGPYRAHFSMAVRANPPPESRGLSEDHSDQAFWERGGGRLTNDSDCQIHPVFTVGDTYLVFYGPPLTRRSFEHIHMVGNQPFKDDKWMNYVERRLSGPWTGAVPAPPWERTRPDHSGLSGPIWEYR